ALFALGIGVYILYSALRMAYDAVQSLLDRALPVVFFYIYPVIPLNKGLFLVQVGCVFINLETV
ncbi:MAG: hypothetical protein E6604_10285, partial [Veillonella sp.]|nr:hypothetical protein [Veillonella sp.]